MSKFKVGDKVRVIKLSEVDLFDFKMGEEFKISRISEKIIGNGYVYFFNCKTSGLYEEQLELAQQLDPKKTYTIQEVLVEENIGKMFEFDGMFYGVTNSFDSLRLENFDGELIEENVNLRRILNGKFTLIEEPKQFTEEIDFKEAFERLCVGEEVKFELPNGGQDILIYKDNILKYKPYDEEDFFKIHIGLEYVGVSCYTKYYKK